MQKSFTLLEMLVVIGIIAVLVSVGIASYSTVQKKSRDAKRQGDLKAAQQMMEQCYSVNSFEYPTISGNGTKTITATCPAPNTSITFTLTDPLGTGTYIYTVTSTTSDYSITVDLETSTTNFTVSNQQ
ncbi:MAG: type II secretion system protein [Patescibacteria group bacterium]